MALHKPYLLLALVLLLTEIAIALFVNDAFLRPIGGDFLVVLLLYTTVRGLTRFKFYPALIGVLLFCYLIEAMQYIHFIQIIGWEKITIARVVMGTYFSWEDMLAYTAGALFILFIETKYNPTLSKWTAS
ncbi:ribosomal maturation YjgA family protein [Runella slithyformis]|uniref:DUF2809 domain-containing protein n=1 Tax=Runella slithyformis (strain ATCC 29530 / DSM 19594 / LMG 11500 / NCIMB 11436 / LSU 4) TaxID=761193 RepID=A0A7U4E7Z3_RUNSL|nr:DUF2809 domain-containing protein [Runella slithyformis]AEI51153.1 hypothetical protein Runsl_4841 [Runella slithyformis DSM 19594]